ncbi:peptidoglycan recognition protein family protein [Spirochaeta cellobiosiphila]|uniref:peptidoglycan recognition protein family protein n=1 Tax=Spirochaeta cellobiosiphila TaxID=504483 RepID=UPI0003FC52DE|nr:peptidoglycan recognition family protein [Spirochaeta cellobiosiphila]
MKLITKPLTINPYSRPGRKLINVKSIVMHWTGVPNQPAEEVWNWFEMRKEGKHGYGSAHYIIDLDGKVIDCIPNDEMAYHCGVPDFQDIHKDPLSGRFYTNYARDIFGIYAEDYKHKSPNNCTIGIEMVAYDKEGHFHSATLNAASELVRSLLDQYKLDKNTNVTTHHNIVGWKDCPRLWTNNPHEFEKFKQTL